MPKDVRNSLVPEKAVKHAKKMLTRDYRMRIFMPKDCYNGAMYLCKQGHVDLANSTCGGTFLLYITLLGTSAMSQYSTLFVFICVFLHWLLQNGHQCRS